MIKPSRFSNLTPEASARSARTTARHSLPVAWNLAAVCDVEVCDCERNGSEPDTPKRAESTAGSEGGLREVAAA